MLLEARAKINWTLEIKGVREDGYHLLQMLMQPITLCDLVELQPADEIVLRCEGNPQLTSDRSNLAFRAAEALLPWSRRGAGVSIRVTKRIPSGAGLGGGSADAAAVLVGLNELWQCGLTKEQLCEIGLKLGADVPFCVSGGLTEVSGIGERLSAVGEAPELPLVIVQPCRGLSTKEIYAMWDRQRPDDPVCFRQTAEALSSGRPECLPPVPGNSLEAVSRAIQPEIAEAEKTLFSLGACCAQMSGSGSAVYGVFDSHAKADAAYASLSHRWERVYRCATCAHSTALVGQP